MKINALNMRLVTNVLTNMAATKGALFDSVNFSVAISTACKLLNVEKAERCIVFCQTRKQYSILYRLFTAALGKKNFVGSSSSYNHCLVQMFHASSPDSVKSHVVKEMTKENSHLRLLICTIAFGMGIDCKDIYRSINFGPSSTVDNLMQEAG